VAEACFEAAAVAEEVDLVVVAPVALEASTVCPANSVRPRVARSDPPANQRVTARALRTPRRRARPDRSAADRSGADRSGGDMTDRGRENDHAFEHGASGFELSQRFLGTCSAARSGLIAGRAYADQGGPPVPGLTKAATRPERTCRGGRFGPFVSPGETNRPKRAADPPVGARWAKRRLVGTCPGCGDLVASRSLGDRRCRTAALSATKPPDGNQIGVRAGQAITLGGPASQ
jgi:hypothetical protein